MTTTPSHPPARTGLRPGHWLLIALVGLLLAGAVFVIARRDSAHDPQATSSTPTPTTAPATDSAAIRPDCVPQITATGLTPRLPGTYGFTYTAACDQVVRELGFQVTALDAKGAVLAGSSPDVVSGGVLFPGHTLAAAGEVPVHGKTPAKIRVEVVHYLVESPDAYTAWARDLQVVDLVRGKPDELGTFTITGSLHAESETLPLCVAGYVLLLRDKAGEILYAQQQLATITRTPTFDVAPTDDMDFAHTQIFALQTPRTEQPPRAGVTCDGR
ncbi:hypothetical protein [Actinoplanes regularis]|uniref:Uncharacterized protein n=1 Tax=Actinoplanes regularis TaxID=52697 RepID=A0A238WTA4_9ACTN|nr:hypothetical protein [Actinoplanes regularis]GIE84608.1 hypothetical protein Are01nite_10880 [Actinoplanes regularis]SNR48889.1 hypothetical protein SAMN06264365_102810 [Actinoplanes regularis]